MLKELEKTYKTVSPDKVKYWINVAKTTDFPVNGGAAVQVNGLQVAIFNFTRRNEWYATQNLCPHKKQMIISRGMIGSENEELKVACPFHKKTFSLKNGKNLNGNECALATYPIKVEGDEVYIGFEGR